MFETINHKKYDVIWLGSFWVITRQKMKNIEHSSKNWYRLGFFAHKKNTYFKVTEFKAWEYWKLVI